MDQYLQLVDDESDGFQIDEESSANRPLPHK